MHIHLDISYIQLYYNLQYIFLISYNFEAEIAGYRGVSLVNTKCSYVKKK